MSSLTIDNASTEGNNGAAGEADLFAALLDTYEPVLPERGQYITGTIISVDDNMILADVGAKRTAIVPPQEIARLDEMQLASIKAGDEVMLYVTRTPSGDDELQVSLERGLQFQDWQKATTLLESEETVDLTVVGHNSGGILVQFERLQGFIPNSHLPEIQHIHNKQAQSTAKSKMVGSVLPVKALEVSSQRKRLVFSARAAMPERRQQRLQELKEMEGEIVTGTVANLVDYGAFVALDGAEGLLHISEIAWQQVRKPGDVLRTGEEIKVKILSVDADRERVSLSRKALLPNPWQQFAADHKVGDLLEVTVTNVADFGAFAVIEEGIEGLIHISEMYVAHDAKPVDVISAGDKVLVRIVRLEPDRERIGLSQRQVSESEELEWTWQKSQAAAAEAEAQAAAGQTDAEAVASDDEPEAVVETEVAEAEVAEAEVAEAEVVEAEVAEPAAADEEE